MTATGAALSTIYKIDANLAKYGTTMRPHCFPLDRPQRVTKEDKDALLEWLLREGWRTQSEMVEFLRWERSKKVSTSTVCRLLQEEKWSRKVLQRTSKSRNKELREIWCQDVSRFPQENLVFLDESYF